jgi:hypothetical protein
MDVHSPKNGTYRYWSIAICCSQQEWRYHPTKMAIWPTTIGMGLSPAMTGILNFGNTQRFWYRKCWNQVSNIHNRLINYMGHMGVSENGKWITKKNGNWIRKMSQLPSNLWVPHFFGLGVKALKCRGSCFVNFTGIPGVQPSNESGPWHVCFFHFDD